MKQWFLVEDQRFWNKEKLDLTTPFLFYRRDDKTSISGHRLPVRAVLLLVSF